MPNLIYSLLLLISGLLAMAFYTLLERKTLSYMQLRKGPNKVSLIGIPQPFADAMKLFLKERTTPSMANQIPFWLAPSLGLLLALFLWTLYPHPFSLNILNFSVLLFLCLSSMNVYVTLTAGFASNSKYALLGAFRSVAQTISYEISMSLTLLNALLILKTFNMTQCTTNNFSWPMLIMPPVMLIWITTILAETNRTPFDLAEGESELVSGFNIEYGSSSFALIFMSEYLNIIIISVFTSILFSGAMKLTVLSTLLFTSKAMIVAFLFIWMRATLPRIRYDQLMSLTWTNFLPLVLGTLIILLPLTILPT